MLLPRCSQSLPRHRLALSWHRLVMMRGLSCSSASLVRSKLTNRYWTRRPGHSALLDKFVKHTSVDGSLIVKAPVHLKCAASFFDSEGNIDIARNYRIAVQRDEANRMEKVNRRKEISQELENEILGERNTEDTEVDEESDNGAELFMEEEDIFMKEITEEEKKLLEKYTKIPSGTTMVENLSNHSRTRTPLQLSLYGRTRHRVDSYSILSGRQSHTHVYISDASTTEEALSMFSLDNGGPNSVHPSGSVSIFKPREVSEVEISSGLYDAQHPVEEVASSLKVYCPSHLLENSKNGITMVFHTPTLMNKIYLEAQRHGSIDLNCNLMDQLVSVGLLTQMGNIKVRDMWAESIKLATRTGDILCHGTVEGDITAETEADGDFIARSVVGNKLKVTTDAGDICLWDDCHSEVAELFTSYGNVHCKRLYGNTKILIKEQGTATLNVVTGSLAVVVKNGEIIAHIDSISQDSFIELETGDIVIHVCTDFPFRISLVAPRTTVSPHILNSGEFFLSNGLEYFVSGVESSTAEMQPSLSVKCHQGQITLQGPRRKKKIKMDSS